MYRGKDLTRPIGAPDRAAAAMRSCSVAVALLTCSGIATLVAVAALILYDGTPGETASTPVQWPASTTLERSAGKPVLLVFAHPFCRCTDAAVRGLARLGHLRPGDHAPSITFVVLREAKNSTWNRAVLTRNAAALPAARVVWDDGGMEARRFGARTSGYVVLYSARGKLLFAGGVTGSRGHEGDNFGLSGLEEALQSAVAGSDLASPRTAKVFGCSLVTSTAEPTRTELVIDRAVQAAKRFAHQFRFGFWQFGLGNSA